jgi:hypothetical protein
VAENADGNANALVLVWQSGDEPGEVEFVVTSSLAESLLALLAEGGVSAARGQRQARGVAADVLTTVVAVAGSPAACTAIGLVVRKFLDRHKGKRIRVGENGLEEAENFSARDLERIIRTLSAVERTDAERPETNHADAEPW